MTLHNFESNLGSQKHQEKVEDCAAVGWGGSKVGDFNCYQEKKPVLCLKSKLFLPAGCDYVDDDLMGCRKGNRVKMSNS